MHLENVDSALWCALRIGIERHACPEPAFEHDAHRVLFHMINEHARRIELRLVLDRIHDEARPFEFVLKMWRVHEHHQVARGCKFEMRFEDLHLVARIFIESNLADAEHARTIEKLWDERDDFAREDGIFRFLRIDAEPGVMSNAVLRGALGLEVGELPEVVLKSFGRRSIVARPKCWLRRRWCDSPCEYVDRCTSARPA